MQVVCSATGDRAVPLLILNVCRHVSVQLIDTVKKNFPPETKMAILGTIQFAPGMTAAKVALNKYFSSAPFVPQAKPLSPGEVLGCTSPSLEGYDAFVFVADGRFHLEVRCRKTDTA